jgi:DNA polymerase-1
VVFDTMIGAYLLAPGQGSPSVEGVAADYLGRFLGDAGGPGKGPEVTLKQASGRCCLRARVLVEARPVMEQELRSRDLWDLFNEIEMPLAGVLAEMESRGIRVDRRRLEDLAADLEKRLAMIEKEAYALAGRRFNLNSPREIGRVLFDEIGLKPRRRTKTGYSTDISVLTELAAEHDLPRRILEHRQLAKIKSAHVDQLLRFADPESDRIYASFNQAVTATGRLSSSDPNLQNVPIRTGLGAEIRKAFIPSEPGWVLISADYSQIELRIMAHLSMDERLIEAFNRDADIHRETAAFIFKVEPSGVTADMRSLAKSVNFGILYGMGAQSLARGTGLSVEESEGFLAEHKRTYPGVYSWIEKLLQGARTSGYVETLLGRRRLLPDISSERPAVRAAAERMAINTPVQGSAADLIKIAMIELYNEMVKHDLKGGIVVQVHDEILVDCPREEEGRIRALLGEKMGGAYDLAVPLKVEVSSGGSWFEAH